MFLKILKILTIVSIWLFYIVMIIHHLELPLLGYSILMKSLMILGGTIITVLSVIGVILIDKLCGILK
jgi:hypothetical protein